MKMSYFFNSTETIPWAFKHGESDVAKEADI
jgi:hypothetical protein